MWAALANIFLVQAWAPDEGFFFSFNAVSRGLSAEIFFYALFPLLIFDIEKTWAWKLGLTALIVAAGIAYGTHAKLAGVDAALITVNPLPRLFEFMFGICLRRLWGWGGDLVPARTLPATVVELVCLAAVVSFGSLLPWMFHHSLQVLQTDTHLLRNSEILLLPFAATIFVAASGRRFGFRGAWQQTYDRSGRDVLRAGTDAASERPLSGERRRAPRSSPGSCPRSSRA
jgi:hypothetical protein